MRQRFLYVLLIVFNPIHTVCIKVYSCWKYMINEVFYTTLMNHYTKPTTMDDNPHPIKSSTEVNSFDTSVPQILQNAALVSSWAPLFKNSQCNIPPSIAEHPSPGWFCFCKFNSDFTISTMSSIGIEQPGMGMQTSICQQGCTRWCQVEGRRPWTPHQGRLAFLWGKFSNFIRSPNGYTVREIFKFHRES